MITVTIYKDSGRYQRFSVEGHAGYAQEGFDIICAAASALTVNTLNSIERFTEDRLVAEQKNVFLTCQFEAPLSSQAALLMDSMVLGLTDVQNNYGKQYIRLIFKEV